MIWVIRRTALKVLKALQAETLLHVVRLQMCNGLSLPAMLSRAVAFETAGAYGTVLYMLSVQGQADKQELMNRVPRATISKVHSIDAGQVTAR